MNNATASNGKAPDSSPALLIKALCSASAYDHEVIPVRVIETHISWVLLTGRYAYKIKKPVNFGFLDFSTLEKRRFFCAEELRLNRRLSGDMYLEVAPIIGKPETAKIGGTGEAIEYAVKMAQFPEGHLLSECAERGDLNSDEIDQAARMIADFHEIVKRASAASPYGNCQDIKHWFDENFEHIKPLLKDDSHRHQLQKIQAWGNEEWFAKSALMQQRKQQGYVRECHGDLHLGNITLIDGQVIPFDCIEFNPMLRWIDVISEVAFLAMDLLHYGYEEYAFRFLNRYLQHTGDYQGLGLLRYYLVYRAMVRAKVTLLRMQQCGETEYQRASATFDVFMNLAERFTRQDRPIVIITHGYSGSGKSTIAEQLAQKISALQIRSDIERKRLFGYQAQDSTVSGIESGLYAQEATQKTYQHLASLAKAVIDVGLSVIIDAAFLKSWQRELFRQAAIDWNVRFVMLDFLASDEALVRRIRQRKNDASEATVEVLQQQQLTAQPLSKEEQAYIVTVNTESNNALHRLLEDLRNYSHVERII